MGWGGVGWGGVEWGGVGADNVLLLHPHRRVFSRMRGYVMGWGVFLRNQRYVMLRMLRW